MTNIKAIKEGLANSIYEKEPLAQAIISYLDKTNPDAHREIIDYFDEIIEAKIKQFIRDYKFDDVTDEL